MNPPTWIRHRPIFPRADSFSDYVSFPPKPLQSLPPPPRELNSKSFEKIWNKCCFFLEDDPASFWGRLFRGRAVRVRGDRRGISPQRPSASKLPVFLLAYGDQLLPPRNWGNQPYTLPETNMAPENGWLEYQFPFGMAYFQGRAVSFTGGYQPYEVNPGKWSFLLAFYGSFYGSFTTTSIQQFNHPNHHPAVRPGLCHRNILL